MDEQTMRILETLQAMKLRAEACGSTQAAECYAEALALLAARVQRERC